MTSPFSGPLLKVKQSQKHIQCLKKALASYAARVKFGFRKADIPETDLVSWTLLFSEPPPEDVSPLIGDSVHNLRSALDLMICDVARLRDEATDFLAFPFAKDEQRSDKEIKNREIARLGNDIVDLVKAEKPYPEGNRALSGLHELDITDKHHMILPAYEAAPFGDIQMGPLSIFPGGVMHMMLGGSITLARGNRLTFKQQGEVTAIFPNVSPFPRAPVVEVLDDLAKLVTEIIDRFSAHLSERSSDRA
jgi:hypothetical protein